MLDGEERLTPQQAAVVRLIREGLTNRQIAIRLNIAEGTVRGYIRGVFWRLRINSREQLKEGGE